MKPTKKPTKTRKAYRIITLRRYKRGGEYVIVNSEHIEDLIVRLRLLMQKKHLFIPVMYAMRSAADTLELLIGNVPQRGAEREARDV